MSSASLDPVGSVDTTNSTTAKAPQGEGGLRTPSPTPGPSLGRVEANNSRKDAENQTSTTSRNPQDEAANNGNTPNEKVNKEINRILKCKSYVELLRVPPNATEKRVILAWRELGCLIHPKYANHENATAAYEKLKTAARGMGLDETDQDDVDSWDGESEFDPPTARGEDSRMDEDDNPIPPERVVKLYEEATPSLHVLAGNPHDLAAREVLEKINTEIRRANKSENLPELEWLVPINELVPHYSQANTNLEILKNNPTNQDAMNRLMVAKNLVDILIEKKHLPKSWNVSTANRSLGDILFDIAEEANRVHGQVVLIVQEVNAQLETIKKTKEGRAELDSGTKAKFQAAESAIMEELEILQEAVQAADYASNKAALAKSPPEATGALEAVLKAHQTATDSNERSAAAMKTVENISDTAITSIKYPWTTGEGTSGSLIVGVRRSGRGTQVCVERQEGETIIRRLESASDVGLLEVQKYMSTEDFKNLAEGQSLWSHKDRGDFEELLWVTKSQTKLRNTASRKKDPDADCCVKFRNKGIHILTVTSFCKVLGPTSARSEITRVCERDGFLPPWEAEPVSTYYDKAKLEKNPIKRREMRDKQALENRDIKEETNGVQHLQDRIVKLETSGEGQLQARVEKLETRFDTMETSMNELKGMFKMLMERLNK